MNNKIVSNFIWRLLERFGAQGVTFIVSIVLARLLDPEVYGTVAIIMIFTSILQVFVDSGFGSALIQKKDADDLDFSTVFYFNVVVCVLMYLLLFFTAPLISKFYGNPELTSLIRVASIIILIAGVKNVQQAYVSRNLLFKKFFFATLGGTIGAAVIGIVMATLGFGVWALIAQMLFNTLVDTIILWITVRWRPKKMFSFARLKTLFKYGWKLLVSGLIDTVYNKLSQIIIGKKYTEEDLAYYNKGEQLPSVLVTNINSAIDSVIFPVLSQNQDDKEKIKAMTRKAISIASMIIWPMMVGLGVCATSLVGLILTDKWLPCVPFLRIFCFTYAFWPIHVANLNAIKAVGRSDIFLKLEIIKKVVGLTVLLITMNFGVMAIAYGVIFTSIASQIINTWPNKKLLNYGYLEQIKDILPYIGLSVFMGAVVLCVELFKFNYIITLCIQIPVGIIIYIVGLRIFKKESLDYMIEILRGLTNKFKYNKH